MKLTRLILLLAVLLASMSNTAVAQFHINGGAKFYHLRGGNEFFTGTIELEIINSIGTSFGATVQYGKDKHNRNYISFDPISIVAGLGLCMNYAKMNKMISRIEDQQGVDRETAISILHNNGQYQQMMKGNQAAALLALAGNTKIYIPLGGRNMFDTKYFLAPELSLCRFVKIEGEKMDYCGSAGGRFMYVPTYHLTMSAFGEYQWSYKKDSPAKGWAVGVTIGYQY
ncbi:MAG: hypothetical protein IJU62_02325 [Muribaculaceae bacterium]|nr:hypothetical protein [Muribaculaceae bacterium]